MRTAKAYLNRYQRLKGYIRARQTELAELRDTLIPSSVDYTGITVQTSPHDKMAEIMAEIDSLEQRITDATIDALKVLRDIEDVVQQMKDPRQQTLVINYYLNGSTWEQTAEAMGYDLRWIYRLHGQALDSVEEILTRH